MLHRLLRAATQNLRNNGIPRATAGFVSATVLGFGGAASMNAAGGTTETGSAAKYVPPRVWVHQTDANAGPFANINAPTSGAREVKPLPVGEHPIQLYSLGTPNGVKITILLEELAELMPKFEYDAFLTPISGDQFGSGFVELNPNSKIPAMFDRSVNPPIPVFESVAIMIYLAEKYPKCNLLPKDGRKRAEVMSWLMWQTSSAPFLGGGFGHFYAYAPEKLKYPIDRYTMEVKRQLDVLDKQLAKGKFICGDTYSLADIAIWPWYGQLVLGRLYNAGEFLNVSQYTNVIRWATELEQERPAVRRGRMVNRPTSWPFSGGPLYENVPSLPERHHRSDWAKAAAEKAEKAAAAATAAAAPK